VTCSVGERLISRKSPAIWPGLSKGELPILTFAGVPGDANGTVVGLSSWSARTSQPALPWA
jgi:hypothetical protein